MQKTVNIWNLYISYIDQEPVLEFIDPMQCLKYCNVHSLLSPVKPMRNMINGPQRPLFNLIQVVRSFKDRKGIYSVEFR